MERSGVEWSGEERRGEERRGEDINKCARLFRNKRDQVALFTFNSSMVLCS